MNNQISSVVLKDGKAVVDSRDVALHFEKEHKSVLRDIRELEEKRPELVGCNFVPYSYVAENGKSNPCVLMDRKGFTLLAMGFTGEKALDFKIAFIDAFDKMESQLKRQSTPTEVLYEIVGKMVEAERKLIVHEGRLDKQQAEMVETVAIVEGLKTSIEVYREYTEEKLSEINAKLPNQDEQYYTVLGYANLCGIQIDRHTAQRIGKDCSAACKQQGIDKLTIPDQHFGKVGLYPQEILELVFKANSLI